MALTGACLALTSLPDELETSNFICGPLTCKTIWGPILGSLGTLIAKLEGVAPYGAGYITLGAFLTPLEWR